MNKKQKVISILAIIISIGVVIYLRNYNLVIYLHGYSARELNLVEHGYDTGNHEFKVVEMENNKNFALGILKKDKLGLWTIEQIEESSLKSNQYLSIMWVDCVGYNYTTKGFIYQTSLIFHGNNAIKPIIIDSTKIPHGITYYVEQYKESYTIRFDEYEEGSLERIKVNLDELLKGYVKTD